MLFPVRMPVLFALYACVTMTSRAPADVIYVNISADPGGDGSSWAVARDSLPDALGAAVEGDQIWVARGTYVGRVNLVLGVKLYGGFDGTETTLEQRDWTANRTILDGNQSGAVVTAPRDATATTRIDGFTITNGGGGPFNSHGGGISLSSTSPTIANNTISGNHAADDEGLGGGVYLDHSHATLVNSTITNNSAADGGGVYLRSSDAMIWGNTIARNHAEYGAGLYLEYSIAAITNNTITDNSATLGGGLYIKSDSPLIEQNRITVNSAHAGGGLYLSSTEAVIRRNVIVGNVTFEGDGGGAKVAYSDPRIANNWVSGNSARGDGGGLYFLHSQGAITNNTIASNRSAGSGGGLSLEDDSAPSVANCIIAFNSSGLHSTASTPTLRSNCVYGNAAYDFDGLADPTGTDGNISAEPLLADTAYGNLRIQPGSPCLDAGRNLDASGNYDIDGDPRILPSNGTVDIGADESDGTTWAQGPAAIVRVSTDGDDANDGSSWPTAKRTVQGAIDAVHPAGVEVWVREGAYEENIRLHPYAHVYGGFAGGESARDERDWVVHVTTLDGRGQGPVVTALAGFGNTDAIDGFTLTNGSGARVELVRYGGGVYVSGGDLTIANCAVTGNGAGGGGGGGLYLTLSSSVVSGCTVTANDAGLGGGLYLTQCDVTVSGCSITANNGGGLYLSDCLSTIVDSTIARNDALIGGGFALHNGAVPAITRCVIKQNTSWEGAGVYVDKSAPSIVGCAITGNESQYYGGGLSVRDSSPTLAFNMVADNEAFEGGGLYMTRSSPTMTGDTISGNRAVSGAGLYVCTGSSPAFTGSAVTGNRARIAGGGLYALGSSPTIVNCTIAGNSAAGGGGIYSTSSSPTMVNTIVAYNSSGIDDVAGTPTLRYNCVYGNTDYDVSGFADPTGSEGNIAAPPRFARVPGAGADGDWGTGDDDPGDLRIRAASPCIDAGDNDAVPPDTLDLDGDGDTSEPVPVDLAVATRFVDDPLIEDAGLGIPPVVDIGAYEFPADTIGDCNESGSLDLVDYRSMSGCLDGPAVDAVAGCACTDMDFDGHVDLADFAALQVRITLP